MLDAFIEERLPSGHRINATAVVMIQHQLGSIVPLTKALISLGVDATRVYWLDIPYSANTVVASKLIELGIPPANFAPGGYNLEQRYAPYQHRRVAHLVATLRGTFGPDDRLLVLDDGAYFAQAAACFRRALPQVALVEQTRRGMRTILDDLACRSYVQSTHFVDVADSPPKVQLEPAFIADAILRAMQPLAAQRESMPHGPTLLLGYGAIGRAVAHALVDHFGLTRSLIHVHDRAPAALAAAQRDGFGIWNRAGPPFTEYGWILGCSGNTSLSVGDRVCLADRAVLTSTSSGAAELSRETFIELADANADDDIFIHERDTLASRSIHSNIELHLVDRDVTFLNGGFPLNFDGNVNNVPAAQIQLTRTLMLAAAIQATEAKTSGIQALDRDTCDWLTARFAELTGMDPPERERPSRQSPGPPTGGGGLPAQTPGNSVEYARGLHAEVLDTNSAFYTRTQLLLTLNGVILAVIGATLLASPSDLRAITDAFGPSTYALAGGAGAALIWSILVCVNVVRPTHRKGDARHWEPPDRLWYFRHIAEHIAAYGREDFIRKAMHADDAFETRARLSQVATMTPIMLARVKALDRAFRLTALALVLLALTAVDYLIRVA